MTTRVARRLAPAALIPAALVLLAAVPVAAVRAAPADVTAAGPAQRAVLAAQVEAARAADPGFTPSAERGRTLFTGSPGGGKPDSPSCTSCHGDDPRQGGHSRAGKPIAPLAPSVVPARLTDAADVAKWLRRNCAEVLGRDCTAAEKADLVAFLISQ
ncbi:Cytochrome c-type protein SHP [Rhodoplanes sp. P11]|uniref:DUF1924 domain-containing protein n=1 Tax=Rhodoplanes sp. P11 TaxID=3157621 RepID=UPI0035E5A59A